MTRLTAMPPVDELAGLDIVVSPALPMQPSPAEDARRIVRHGYHDAGMWPAAAGEVGPRPGAPTRAMKIGRQLLVDRLLVDEIRREQDRRRHRAERERRRREQELADLQAIATSIGVRRVTAYDYPDVERMIYRAHLGPEGTYGVHVDVSLPWGKLARHPNTSERIAYVAAQLRTKLAEYRVDEEAAARGGDR